MISEAGLGALVVCLVPAVPTQDGGTIGFRGKPMLFFSKGAQSISMSTAKNATPRLFRPLWLSIGQILISFAILFPTLPMVMAQDNLGATQSGRNLKALVHEVFEGFKNWISVQLDAGSS